MVEVGLNFGKDPFYMKLTNRLAIASTAAAVLLMAGAASAQDVTFNAGVTSDYVTRGSSQTNHDAAVSGGVDVTYESGFYVGAWASSVDFEDGTDAEIDFYAGYRTEAAGFGLDFGVASYNYTNAPSNLNMVEALVTVTRPVGPLATTLEIAYSPDYFNLGTPSLWTEARASLPVSDKLSVSGGVGYQHIDNEALFPSYATYNVGVGYALTSRLALDVRYTDNDLPASSGFFADDSFSVGLTASF